MYPNPTILTILSLAFLLTFANLAQAAVSFDYYRNHNCAAANFASTRLTIASGCVDLKRASQSFHIGGPKDNTQVRPGCKIMGYRKPACQGQYILEIRGPSKSTTCYVTGDNPGGEGFAKVRSIQMICAAP